MQLLLSNVGLKYTMAAQSQQDAAQTSRNDFADDEAELEGKLAAAEARAVASEERASGLELRNKELRQDLASSRSASIGVQMIVDASRGRIHVWEVEQIAAKSLGASAKDLVHDLRKVGKNPVPCLRHQQQLIRGRGCRP